MYLPTDESTISLLWYCIYNTCTFISGSTYVPWDREYEYRFDRFERWTWIETNICNSSLRASEVLGWFVFIVHWYAKGNQASWPIGFNTAMFYSARKMRDAMSFTIQSIPSTNPFPVTALHGWISQWCDLNKSDCNSKCSAICSPDKAPAKSCLFAKTRSDGYFLLWRFSPKKIKIILKMTLVMS